MIELKVAAKETVKLAFGGNDNWPRHEYLVDDDRLRQACHHEEEIERLKGCNDEQKKTIKNAWAERDQAARERHEIAKQMQDLEKQKMELYRENVHLRGQRIELERELHKACGQCVKEGTPLYLIDEALKNKIHQIAIAMPEWQPIETAPKDGNKILAWVLSPGMGWRSAIVKWAYSKWVEQEGSIYFENVNKWMPLPEPPKK